MTVRELGRDAVMVNCNPETVSTDYDTSDRLYFEPLTVEDVLEVIELERPAGTVVQFGGQTPLRIARELEAAGVTLLGTSVDSIDLAEDRGRFGAVLAELGILHPPYGVAESPREAVERAREVGFPLLVRPSYVLGGRAMEICYSEDDLSALAVKISTIVGWHDAEHFLQLKDGQLLKVSAATGSAGRNRARRHAGPPPCPARGRGRRRRGPWPGPGRA